MAFSKSDILYAPVRFETPDQYAHQEIHLCGTRFLEARQAKGRPFVLLAAGPKAGLLADPSKPRLGFRGNSSPVHRMLTTSVSLSCMGEQV